MNTPPTPPSCGRHNIPHNMGTCSNTSHVFINTHTLSLLYIFLLTVCRCFSFHLLVFVKIVFIPQHLPHNKTNSYGFSWDYWKKWNKIKWSDCTDSKERNIPAQQCTYCSSATTYCQICGGSVFSILTFDLNWMSEVWQYECHIENKTNKMKK